MKRIFCMLLVLAVLSGCTTLKTPEIKGIVVDAETGKPIADARVYAKWQKTVSGPGGKTRGGIAKELRLKTDSEGKFVIPSYALINYAPYPLGQGGNFLVVVYAHGYKFKQFEFYDQTDIKSPRYEEFIITNNQIKLKLTELINEKQYWENIRELDINDPHYDIEDYNIYISKYPNSANIPRAKYYIGYTYEDELKDYDNAIKEFEQVIKTYPKSDAASSSKQRILYLKNKLQKH